MTAGTAPTAPVPPPAKERSPFRVFALGLLAILLADLLSFGLLFFVINSQQHEQSRKTTQQTTDQFYLLCLGSTNSRAGLRVMVHLAYDTQGRSLDLTHIPGFDALDPATKAWVENVAKATAGSGTNTSQRDQILALFPDPNCEHAYPTHTPGLHLADSPVPVTTTTVP